MNDNNEIIENIPLRDQMADIIRKMIIRGELAENEQISERNLSIRYGISTTPIKEALRLLEAEGLVYIRPRVGTYVVEMPKDRILQICYMRACLEGVASFFAAKYRTEDDIRQMEEYLLQAEAVMNRHGDRQEISRMNRGFHHVLRNASKNSYLVTLITRMNSIENTIRELQFETKQLETNDMKENDAHREILRAVIDGDSDLAEKLSKEHVQRNYQILLAAMEESKTPR